MRARTTTMTTLGWVAMTTTLVMRTRRETGTVTATRTM
jgi:hypothetical protein